MILVDTSGLLAALDPRQAYHNVCARELLRSQRRILSPFVLAELDYLIAKNSGQAEELKLLDDISRGAYQLETFTASDVDAAIEVIRRYSDLDLGLADASIVALAHCYGCGDLLTLDQRHFRAISGPEGNPFRLLPFDL